jgi:hypothetical protein
MLKHRVHVARTRTASSSNRSIGSTPSRSKQSGDWSREDESFARSRQVQAVAGSTSNGTNRSAAPRRRGGCPSFDFHAALSCLSVLVGGDVVDNSCVAVDDPAVAAAYAYELRRGEDILSTGRLTAERDLAPGDELTVAGVVARVQEVNWTGGSVGSCSRRRRIHAGSRAAKSPGAMARARPNHSAALALTHRFLRRAASTPLRSAEMR